jgi:predicted RNase H-like HicB family nuclease
VKYAVVIEKATGNYSAYVPDLPGCVSTGRSVEEAECNIRKAIALHIAGLRDDGEHVPRPTTRVAELEIV